MATIFRNEKDDTKENKNITIKNLSKKLLVSEITIKSDLDYLQKTTSINGTVVEKKAIGNS